MLNSISPGDTRVRNVKGQNAPTTLSDAERFWAKVQKTDGCWLWTAARESPPKLPYGIFTVGPSGHMRNVRAHRFSWILHNGAIPEEQRVLHTCDNPPCVRPDHLYIGTNAKNSQDMVAKRRQMHGEGHYDHVLTEEDVREARHLRDEGVSFYQLAARYGVSRPTITRAVKGITWRYVK